MTSLILDPEKVSWEDLAACRGMGYENFFTKYETDPVHAEQIDELCMTCPVQRQCGDFAREHEQEGCWGGIYWTPTGDIDTVRNAHKTKETWKKLKKVFDIDTNV